MSTEWFVELDFVFTCTMNTEPKENIPLSIEGQDSDESEVQTGKRVKTFTEKGLLWQITEKRKFLRSAVGTWCRHATKIETLWTDTSDTALLKKERDSLEVEMNIVSNAYEYLNELLPVDIESQDYVKFENAQSDHYSLVRKISEVLREIDFQKSVKSAKSSKSAHSQKSRRSHSSGGSNVSKESDYATEAAGLRAKLRYVNIETTKQAELVKKQAELVKKQAELDNLQTQKKLDVVEAKLHAISKFEQGSDIDKEEIAPDGMQEYLESYLEKHSNVNSVDFEHKQAETVATPTVVTSGLNPLVTDFAPRCLPVNTCSEVQTKSTLVYTHPVSSAIEATGNLPRITPPFSEFQRYVVKEAEIPCDPITSFQALKQSQSYDSKKSTVATKPKQTTGSVSFATSTDASTSGEQGSNNPVSYILCKESHNLDSCNILISKSLDDRKVFIRENKLCFGCLKPGHRVPFCKKKARCKICSKPHTTPLHGDFRKVENSADTTTKNPKSENANETLISMYHSSMSVLE